ncbi:group III truncated hemoglobin [Parapedobacter indicus]|uniref:Hemoglobin n=1 Tax=Parapedobacter indicus TaxID=1477437 RepID=A0A1I3LWS7_9SPHI|nr:group III truncated hemoglobin [Parapedobacter indicus]PPL01362.1 hemoglobin [Parapedobacter indicus]SFI89020.1 hemoglobin [Parapedobacter indicus]
MKKDIKTITDIKLLVDTFYASVQKDGLIGPIFHRVIQGRWPEHLDKMYRFWQTVLLDEHTYFGGPFPPHAELPIKKEHFSAWLGLWRQTVDDLFAGDKAEEAKWRAEKMAEMFLFKIEYYRQHTAKPLL